ncbi:MAG: GGDEF domain-containing protein [Sedimenticola sp.]
MAGASAKLHTVFATLLTLIIGFGDFITGNEMSFSVFYIIPVGYGVWYAGGIVGTVLSLFSAVAWLIADVISGHVYSAGWLLYWNAGVRLSIFIFVVFLLVRLKRQLKLEESLADQDALTGLNNRRVFYEQCDMAVARFDRYAEHFTLAYLDLDNFKLINDTMGHEVGDKLLVEVANCLRDKTRSYDIHARLGGDEFVCLFPRSGWQEGKALIGKLHDELNDLFADGEWSVTPSLGGLTVDRQVADSREIISAVDALMYTVKKSGKNAVLCKKLSELSSKELTSV